MNNPHFNINGMHSVNITSRESHNRTFTCPCCETIISPDLVMRGGLTDAKCDWCRNHCGPICTRAANNAIGRIFTVPLFAYRFWEWINHNPREKKDPVVAVYPPPTSQVVEGELYRLWLGDCAGWTIEINTGELAFRHRCGYYMAIRETYLANALAAWFDNRHHTC